MAFSRVNSAVLKGLDVNPVLVEAHIDTRGFPTFNVVGLPAKEVNESRERVKSAIKNSGFKFPNYKITVNLSPAGLPKKGALYDLPIALALLKCSGIVTANLENLLIYGELSLNGGINYVPGGLNFAHFSKSKFGGLCCPEDNLYELNIIPDLKVVSGSDLKSIVSKLNKGEVFITHKNLEYPLNSEGLKYPYIKGQLQAKRALQIAAAGRHNLMLLGPPGIGKTLLAKSIIDFLPFLDETELLPVNLIYSTVFDSPGLLYRRPFRNPHQSAGIARMFGTSSYFGEITLAHRGFLFMDEFSGFSRGVIDGLRVPLECGTSIETTDGVAKNSFPAKFTLLAAANACACGNLGHPQKSCICSEQEIQRYRRKFSAPILDRIDLFCECTLVESHEKLAQPEYEAFEEAKERIEKAVEIQSARFSKFKDTNLRFNSDLNEKNIREFINLDADAESLLDDVSEKYKFSLRNLHKVLKVSRTIADLSSSNKVKLNHIAEALQYRSSIYFEAKGSE